MMKFKKCPRCEDKAFEALVSYGICHSCNYNSVEGLVWKKRRNFLNPKPIIHIPEIHDENHLREACSCVLRFVSPGALFTRTDYSIVRQALVQLPDLWRKIIVLKFWNKLALEEIAKDLGVHRDFVSKILSQSLQRLKEICLERPAFSRSSVHPIFKEIQSEKLAA